METVTKFNKIRVRKKGKIFPVFWTRHSNRCEPCMRGLRGMGPVKGVDEFVLPYSVNEREVETGKNGKYLTGKGYFELETEDEGEEEDGER